jgi:signal transduction histidine kinase
MRLTFRAKLMAIVGIAALAFLLLIAAGSLIGAGVELQLATIQTRYLPRVGLEARLDGEFDRIRREFQDAVAMRDTDELSAIVEMKRHIVEQLDGASGAVDPADAAALRSALEDYLFAARDVSRRLIAGDTGEPVVAAASAMQAKQVRVTEAIRRVGALDPADLTRAFAAAARAERLARSYQLAISVACLVTVIAVSLALSRGVLRAMGELSRGLERFGRGQFEQPIQVRSNDELGQVAREANRMAGSLERVERERERAETDLRLSNKELEAFSYSVAHDLRAPLRGINGFSRALLEDWGDKLDAEATDYLRRIAAAAQRMGELIDALLALSRVTRTEVRRETVDLTRVAEAIVLHLRQGQPDRAVEFVSQPGVSAHGDPTLLRAILENLLANSWKFTANRVGARIAFGAETKDGERVYFVRDNGAGFDMAYAKKLFTPFQRLHSTAEFAGTGVGLATVQRIVQRHGGRIWADGAVGQGATFQFTIPSDEEGPTS